MKKMNILAVSLLLVVASVLFGGEESKTLQANTDPTYAEDTAENIHYQGELVDDPLPVFEENGITYQSSGSTGTIAGDIAAGAIVTITAGSGTIVLQGALGTSQLNVNGGNITIDGNGSTLTNSLNITNATVSIDDITIRHFNYAVVLKEAANFTLGSRGILEGTGNYTSTIVTDQDAKNITMVLNGTLKSTQQGIGVEARSIVDSIVLNGRIELNGNFGAISTTFGGYIKSLSLTETSSIVAEAGLAIYASDANAKIDEIHLNGTVNARTVMTTGGGAVRPSIGNIYVNGEMTSQSAGFNLSGNVNSITFSEYSKMTSLRATYGAVFTNAYSTVQTVTFNGFVSGSYMLAQTTAGAYVGTVNYNSSLLELHPAITNVVMLYNAGRVEQLNVRENVKILNTIDGAFTLGATGSVGEVHIKGIIDSTSRIADGRVFNGVLGNQVNVVDIDDALLFGEAVNFFPRIDTAYTSVVPVIELSNKRFTDVGVAYNINMPNVDASMMEVKVAIMNTNYDVLQTLNVNPHEGTIVIPHAYASDFFVANYAKDAVEQKIVLTSAKSEIVHYEAPIKVDANDVTYSIGNVVDEAQFLLDTGAMASEGTTIEVDLSVVDFNKVNDYIVRIQAIHPSGMISFVDIIVHIIDSGETLQPEGPETMRPIPGDIVETGDNSNKELLVLSMLAASWVLVKYRKINK